MGSTYYDWSPLFDAVNQNVNRYSEQNRYNAMLQQLIGTGTPTPQLAAIPSHNVPMPSMKTEGGATLGGNSMSVNPGPINVAPPALNGSYGEGTPMTYNGPAGQALGSSANTLLPLLRNAPPSMGFPLLLQSVMKNADRQQQIQDSRLTPMTNEEKAALGYKPDAVVYKDIAGNPVVKQASDMLSEGARGQKLDMARQEGIINAEAPLTRAQKLADERARAQAAETKRYHDQMGGLGLTEDGIQSPVVQSWVQNILNGNANLQNVPAPLKNAVSQAMNSAPATVYSPTAKTKNTLAASRITAPYTNMAAYKLTADGLPYLQRIDAASKHPGSVSDQDLLDSLTKLNTGGNAVTEAQVTLITGHGSLSDWAGTLANKLKNGGALSDNQRKQIKEIASDIFKNYRKGYQPIYEQAASQLRAAGVPEPFWTIPDLNKLNAGQADILDDKGNKGGGGDKPDPLGIR